MTVEGFTALANRLAPKVNLFHSLWEADPEAELFGGTSRDYLFWLKRQFAGVTSRGRAERIIKKLESREVIDVREFIVGDSDVDILSGLSHLPLDAREFGMRKLDVISRERLDPNREMGKTERRQGYLPMEKIRLSRQGLVRWPDFGNGVKELYDGNPTVHFSPPAVFAKTHYAKEGRNHPILLAIRYARLVAMTYFNDHGSDYPDKKTLFRFAPDSEREVRRVVAEAAADKDGKLAELLVNGAFGKKFDDTVAKVFRSYTNPTAGHLLFKHLGLDGLWGVFQGLAPINQYLFAKQRAPEAIAANLKKYEVNEKDFFESPRSRVLELHLEGRKAPPHVPKTV